MAQAEIYPFAEIGGSWGERYPVWIRALDRRNGVYVIRELESDGIIAYVGESHSDRLYGTLTRHFQRWSAKYNTAGPTYDRARVEVAVVLVPKSHALYLQNDLICALEPRDNLLVCGQIFESADVPADEPANDAILDKPPRGYDYDILAIIDGLFYPLDTADNTTGAAPF